MATSSDIIFYRFSPENMDKNTLQKLFVGRGKLLESLFKELENAARKKTPRFYLIVGPRGIGKSHFLVLLYYEIQNKLGSLLIPIKLAEEEYSVFRASDLFLRILEEKSENTSDILSLKKEDEILDTALEKLKQISKRDKKGYVIFVENLHELFRQLDTEELQKLRAIFQKHNFFSIVATAPMVFPAVTDHDEPFFNFFDVQHLREFSLPEIMELIQKIAELEDNKKFLEEFIKYELRIHGMSHLTGGSPRLVILFYEMITKGELENIEKAFLKIIDEHTPYYQEIFQLLPTQRRRIFDILISAGAPITPKQISNKARIDLPTVTTQLRRLEKDGYIISRPTGRRTYYEVRERLFRLWREMRQPFGRKRVSVLLEFLQLWYTPDERRELFKTKFELLEAGERTAIRDICYCAEILPLKFKPDALLKVTSKLLELGEWDEAEFEIQKLKEIATDTKNDKLKNIIILYEGSLLLSKEKYENALEAFEKVLEINPKNELALKGKGDALESLKKYGEALEAFNKVLEINQKDDYVLSGKGRILGNLSRYEEALEAFNKALEINPMYDNILENKGITLLNLNRYEEALETFNKALEINPTNDNALSKKGIALVNLDRYEEALEAFNKTLEINPKDSYTLANKGEVLLNIDRFEEALEILNKAIEIDPKDHHALANIGLALLNLNREDESLEAFSRALEIEPNCDYTLYYKGVALVFWGRSVEALDTFNHALEINPNDVDLLTQRGHVLSCGLDRHEDALESFNKALEINSKNEDTISHKGSTLARLGRYEEALEVFNRALEINPNDVSALADKGLTLENLGMHEEALQALENAIEIDPDYEYGLVNFIDISFSIAINELKVGNRGNAGRLIEAAYNKRNKLKGKDISELTMAFLKKTASTGEISLIKAAVDEVIKIKGDEYRELLKPIITAIEIIETKDTQKYYRLQVEEREIVSDIVKTVTRSDELLPDEIKRKEGLKPP
jgi:tetratricopeptide (TPR) repeat protein